MIQDKIPSVITVGNEIKMADIGVIFSSDNTGETLSFGYLVEDEVCMISVRAKDIEKLMKRGRTKKGVK